MATDATPILTATQQTLFGMLPEARKLYGEHHGIVLLAKAALAYRDTYLHMDRCCTVAIEMLVDHLEEAF